MSLNADWDKASPIPSEEWDKATPVGEAKAAPAPSKPSRNDAIKDSMQQALAIATAPASAVQRMAKGTLEGVDTVSRHLGGAATDVMAAQSGRRTVLNPLALEIPAEVSGATGAAASILPGVLLGGGAGRAAAPAVKKEGISWMQSALKPSKAELKSGEGAQAAKTMLDEGVNVTEAGVETLRTKIGTLNDELQAALNQSPATVDKGAVASRLQDLIKKIENSSFNPQQRVKAVEKIYDEVLGNAVIGQKIPVALANKIKSGIYKELGDLKYARMKSGTPVTDSEMAQMALARGAKEEISAAVPQAAPLNSEMGRLINAANIAENRVLSAANRDPGGLAWLTHDLPNFIAMLTARHPASKSIIARALYSNADTGATGVGAGVGGTAASLRRE